MIFTWVVWGKCLKGSRLFFGVFIWMLYHNEMDCMYCFFEGECGRNLKLVWLKKRVPPLPKEYSHFPHWNSHGYPLFADNPSCSLLSWKKIEFPANAPSSTYCWGFLHGILCVHFFMINLKTFSILSTMINIGIVFADYVVIFVNTLLAIRSVNILKPPHSCVLANWSANSTSCMKTGLKKVTKCKRW